MEVGATYQISVGGVYYSCFVICNCLFELVMSYLLNLGGGAVS